jgi:hypothetical protein
MSFIVRILKVLFCAGSSSKGQSRHKQPKRIMVESRNGRKVYLVNQYGEVFEEK